jgi:DNA-binding NarL/FixJ family response regulator
MSAAPLSAAAVPAALLVGDDPERVRDVTRLLGQAGFTVAGRAAGGETLAVLLAAGADVASIQAVEAAAALHPQVPLLAVMSADASGALLRRALRAGACGIVLTDRLAATLAPTAWALAAGQLAVPPSLRRQLAPKALSHREKEILALVVRGLTNRQIAGALFVAESTVKTHLSSAFGKLDARSRAEAAALILDPEEGYGLGILSISEQ